MSPAASLFLWRREAASRNGPTTSRRIVDNLAKQACVLCLRGQAHDRGACAAKTYWLAQMAGFNFFTAELVMAWLGVYTTNTLASILVACNDEYWCQNVPTTLTDVQYDYVTQELRRKCPAHPQLDFIGDYESKTGYHHG
jgi:hypothetical protein